MLQLCNRIGNICIRWICNSKVNGGCFPYLFCSVEKVFCRVSFQLNDFFYGILRNYQRHFLVLHPFHRIAFAVHRLNNKGQVKDHFRIWTQAEGIRPCKLWVHTIPQICIRTKHKGITVYQKCIKHINAAGCLRITMYVYYCYDFFICSNCNFCLKSSLVFAYR